MKKIKILICIAVSSLVLLGVVLVTTKCITEKNSKAVEDGPTIVLDENGEILESDDIHPLPKQMLFSTASEESEAITVSASFTPADANVIKLIWTIAFKNPESEWAKGKDVSEYIKVVPDNATCSVSCLQAFGESIQLTCSSKYNSEIRASCTLDYGRRIITRDMSFQDVEYYEFKNNAYYLDFTSKIPCFSFAVSNEDNCTYGIGTVTLDVDDVFYVKTEENILALFDEYSQEITMTSNAEKKKTKVQFLPMKATEVTILMGAEFNQTEGENFLCYDLMPNYIYDNPDATLFWIVVEITYQGVVLNTFEYPIRARSWSFGIDIESITLNQDSICF